MIINGKKISQEVEKKVRNATKKFSKPLKLLVFSAGQNPANASYIARKQLFAERVGIVLKHVKLPATSTLRAEEHIRKILKQEKPTAAIIQIPLSQKLSADILTGALPAALDVDCLGNGKKYFLSPVILSIQEILRRNHISPKGKTVVIVGHGRLVGKPAEAYFKKQKAHVMICDKYTKDIPSITKKADILVSGAGVANLITPAMVKKGVIALDVGFSQKNGKIIGDIDRAVSRKARVFSGVPGGIGAMTVAYLFHNVVQAKKLQDKAKN